MPHREIRLTLLMAMAVGLASRPEESSARDGRPRVSGAWGGGGDIVIENCADNATAISYSLNEDKYTTQPGQTERVTNDRQWIVEFDRGSGQGTVRYILSRGVFRFRSTDNGWDLFRVPNQGTATRSTAKPPLPNARTAE